MSVMNGVGQTWSKLVKLGRHRSKLLATLIDRHAIRSPTSPSQSGVMAATQTASWSTRPTQYRSNLAAWSLGRPPSFSLDMLLAIVGLHNNCTRHVLACHNFHTSLTIHAKLESCLHWAVQGSHAWSCKQHLQHAQRFTTCVHCYESLLLSPVHL